MPKRPARDDLFAIFPDLPWHPHKTDAEHMRQVKQAQVHAGENVRRQRAATERVRAAIAARRFRQFDAKG
jgi:hypothetical protein